MIAEAGARPHGEPAARIRVLLFEPDTSLAGRMARTLEGSDALELRVTRSLGEALDEARGGEIDAVLLHVGTAAPKAIRLVRRFAHLVPHLPVVVVADGDAGAALRHAGATDTLEERSLGADVLRQTIEEARQRRRADDELRETLSRLAATLESTTDGILVVDREGRIASYNQTFARMWRIPEDVLASGEDERALASVLDQLVDPEAFLAKVRDLYSAPDAESHDVLAFHDGRIFDRFSKPQKIGGATVGRVWSFRDVTERKRAERLLREREERFEKVFRGSLDPVTVTRLTDGKLVEVNDAFLAQTGFGREEVLGRTIASLGLWVDLEGFAEGRRRLLRGETIRDFEARMRMKGGEIRDVLLSATLMEIDGEPHVLSFARDITPLKETEARLREALRRAEQSDRLKTAFLANMSHEIRTPLNVILGYASLVGEHLAEAGDPSQDAIVLGMHRAGQRLLETIHGILDISRMESGAFELKPVELDLAETIAQQVRECRILAERKGLPLECAVDVPGIRVRFDPYCLSHALLNLIGNAIKFTREGQITVRLARDDEGAPIVEVRDTGIGIEAGFLPRLFEPFVQASSGYTRSFEGSGLGLALTKRYLELNGARISVSSEKDRGSTFRITFARRD